MEGRSTARVAFLAEIGWDYAKLEEMGIVSPVLNISCDYKQTTTFSDDITIEVAIREFKGKAGFPGTV